MPTVVTNGNWRLTPRSWGELAAATGVLGAAVWLLVPHWRSNPELSHGWLMPLVTWFLLGEARVQPAWCVRLRGAWVGAGVVLAVGAVALAGMLAASLGWGHGLVAFLAALGGVSLLAAGLAARCPRGAGTRSRDGWPLNFASLAAVGLWVLCAPLPPGAYQRLTLDLQLAVTGGVVTTLHLLGIPALREGNVIQLAGHAVGVEEACSGVRSLVACVYAGVFFAAAGVRRRDSRCLLVVLAPVLAVVANFLRSLLLTWVAARGHEVAGTWHDATGYAVLGATAVLLGTLTWALAGRERRGSALASASPAAETAETGGGRQGALGDTDARGDAAAREKVGWARGLFDGGLVMVGGMVLLFVVAGERHVRAAPLGVAALEKLLPAEVAGWQVTTEADLYRFAPILQTDDILQRTYLRPAGDGGLTQVTIYLAHWPAGAVPASLVASHTPDACWPGVGWQPVGTPREEAWATPSGGAWPAAQSREFQRHGFDEYVWFWHLRDGALVHYEPEHSLGRLLRLSWRYGFRRDGEQWFIRISSNRPRAEWAGDPEMVQILAGFAPLGLAAKS